MKRYLTTGVGLLAASLLAFGCGGDEDEPNESEGNGEDVTCTPGEGGACQNDMDCPKVESGEARSSSRTCGLGCQQDADPATCAVTCIVDDAELTQGCAVCYATLVGCAADNCLAECGANPASDGCNQCQIDSGCRSAFDSCSGLTTAD